MSSTPDKVLDIKNKTIGYVKNKVFDFIAVAIVIAMTVLSLGVVELRETSFTEFINILLECIPFYLAAAMLTLDYYTKGTFAGKCTESYNNTCKIYSQQVNKLTGEEMESIHEFCIYYNEKVLHSKRDALLRSVAVSWKMYDEGVNDEQPLKIMPYRRLKKLYGKDVKNVIKKCKKLRVKGVYSNILLGNNISTDDTDLGENENQLLKARTGKYVLSYALSILLMSFIAVKDVIQWGWVGAFLTLFKVLYIACSAYMKYFDGYQDITINIVNHINRKMDVLKEFEYWYKTNKKSNTTIENV